MEINGLSSSPLPCLFNEIGDCIENNVEKWLENEVAGLRIWQLVGIILSIFLVVIIIFCCFIRFRIPRTKQNIEADYIRKKITKKFREELAKISNADMDEMNLRKALERVRADLDAENEKQQDIFIEKKSLGLKKHFHLMFHGIRTRFSSNQQNHTNDINNTI